MHLLTTLILAVVWAGLVYSTHHTIGYDNATGYPKISEDLLWVGVAILPLILGAFVINSRTGKAKYLRWLCATALGAEAAFLLIPSWLKILGLIPLLGVVLLLWTEISGSKAEEQVSPLSPDKLKQKRRNRWINAFAVAGLTVLLVRGCWYRNPLPSDEQMIEHFNAHRTEFEQLVQGYRNYRRGDVFYERSSDEVKALMKRLGVYQVAEAQGASGTWYPDSYSAKTISILRSLNVRNVGQAATEKERISTLKQELPVLFDGVAPLNNGWDVIRITTVTHVGLGNSGQPGTKFTMRYSGIYKVYYYFPQIPQIREGHILLPEYHSLDERITTRLGQRVFDSLDDYPPDWRRGECVLKRMDDHWFIAMCRNG